MVGLSVLFDSFLEVGDITGLDILQLLQNDQRSRR